MNRIKTLLIPLIIFFNMSNMAFINPSDNINIDGQYKKKEDLKNELKEERKLIDQQRFEEIKLKELEKKEKNSTDSHEENKDNYNENENKKSKTKESYNIPSLIVRLRGKHTTKYLCSYNFTIKANNTENVLSNTIIDDYELLLKKPSLKVRAGEIINFEFSEKPKDIKVYIWGEENNKITLKKNSIKVPDLDKKIVIAIEGKYKDGEIKYAIVLDIRK